MYQGLKEGKSGRIWPPKIRYFVLSRSAEAFQVRQSKKECVVAQFVDLPDMVKDNAKEMNVATEGDGIL